MLEQGVFSKQLWGDVHSNFFLHVTYLAHARSAEVSPSGAVLCPVTVCRRGGRFWGGGGAVHALTPSFTALQNQAFGKHLFLRQLVQK